MPISRNLLSAWTKFLFDPSGEKLAGRREYEKYKQARLQSCYDGEPALYMRHIDGTAVPDILRNRYRMAVKAAAGALDAPALPAPDGNNNTNHRRRSAFPPHTEPKPAREESSSARLTAIERDLIRLSCHSEDVRGDVKTILRGMEFRSGQGVEL